MQYRRAIFLSRDGRDDFTVWAVDLAEDEINSFLSEGSITRGSLNQVMENLPMTSDAPNTMHLLEKDGEGFILHSKDTSYAFIEQHSHEGCSARGDRESIMAEIADCFPASCREV